MTDTSNLCSRIHYGTGTATIYRCTKDEIAIIEHITTARAVQSDLDEANELLQQAVSFLRTLQFESEIQWETSGCLFCNQSHLTNKHTDDCPLGQFLAKVSQ